MQGDPISLWSVVTAVMLPLFGAAFFLLWNRLDKHQEAVSMDQDNVWDAVRELRAGFQTHQVECERRFVKADDLRSLEERLDNRLSRIEDKLDCLVPPFSGLKG